MTESGWIGVDLDGTLAEYHGWNGGIGKPVPLMVKRVKRWLSAGLDVRIFTARVSPLGGKSFESGREADDEFCEEQTCLIEDWCLEHLGQVIPVTYQKDFRMAQLWDDRVICVQFNTGKILGRN